MKTYCIFSAQYLPTVGGVENYTYNLSKELINRGNRVIVVTSNVHNLKKHEIQEGIEIYRLPCINLLNGRFPVVKLNRKFFEIIKLISKIKFDLVIVNTRFYIHSVVGVIFSRMKKIKSIVIEHGTGHLTIDNKVLDKIGQYFEHFLTAIIKQYNKDFYGVSEACNEWLKHFNIKAKSTVYNSIDLDRIEYIKGNINNSFREKYRISKNAIVISFTGRLVKEKGILQLVEAVKRLSKNEKNVYLFVAGDGVLYNELNEISNNNVIMLGRLSFEDIISLLKETDIFCLPSDSEGFPTSVLEAVACNCFIITTERGGAKELIINKEYGIVMNDNKVDTIYYNLVKVIEDVDYRERAIKLSYERLNENFTWKIAASKITGLLE